jgi:SAM-dependent methyltransferase
MEALPEQIDELPQPVYGPYRFVRSLLTPASRVLDVGCGNAKVSAYLATSGALVDGVEPTESRASTAAQRLRYLSRRPAGEDDPQLLPNYDFITFFDVLEHLVDPSAVLAWSAERLAPGGSIIATIPNSAHYSFRLKMLRGDWSMHDWGLFDRTHVRFYDPATMSGLCPSGTTEIERAYFVPGTSWFRRAQVRLAPSLFALHVVIVWSVDRQDDSWRSAPL